MRVDILLRGVLSLDEHAVAAVQTDRDHTVRKRSRRFLAVQGQGQRPVILQLPLVLQLVMGDLIDRRAVFLQAQIIVFIQHGRRLLRRSDQIVASGDVRLFFRCHRRGTAAGEQDHGREQRGHPV